MENTACNSTLLEIFLKDSIVRMFAEYKFFPAKYMNSALLLALYVAQNIPEILLLQIILFHRTTDIKAFHRFDRFVVLFARECSTKIDFEKVGRTMKVEMTQRMILQLYLKVHNTNIYPYIL